MRINFFFLLAVTVSAMAMTACQPTPDNNVVAGKDSAVFESLLAETAQGGMEKLQASSETMDDEAGNALDQKIRDEFTIDNGKINVKLDAEVRSLSGKKPVFRVRPITITPEDVKVWGNYFFAGKKVYDYKVVLSKDDISKKILSLKSRLGSDELYAEAGGSEEAFAYLQKTYQDMIAGYEKLYESAPAETHREETDWTFKKDSYYAIDPDSQYTELEDKTMSLKITSEPEADFPLIWAATRDAEDFKLNSISYINDDAWLEGEEKTISEEEAREMVNDAIKGLKLVDWEIESCVKTHNYPHDADYWNIVCRRTFNGVPMNALPQLGLVKGEGEYAAHYYYEEVYFDVCSGGFLDATWMSPMEIVNVENEDAKVLSLDEALARFKDQISVMYTSGGENRSVRIRRIDQNLVRVKIPDKDYEFYLVPSWSFYGFATGMQNEEEAGFAEGPLVCINGIDGSIINTGLGY